MKLAARTLFMVLPWLAAGLLARGQTSTTGFQHVVVIVQENRTPDNLFQGLCVKAGACSTPPNASQYNIQTSNWRDKTQSRGVIQPLPVPLANTYDLSHAHAAFEKQCDLDTATGACVMDGAASVACSGSCPKQAPFRFVDNSTGTLNPYLDLARSYGWANYMFQTNQGPSFPAHQFLFGGTSAPSASEDAAGIFAAENLKSVDGIAGCIATSGTSVRVISPPALENQRVYPCFDHDTLPDVLSPLVSWKYYAPSAGSIWTAPDAIRHICQPNLPTGGQCTGHEWTKNVDLNSADVLTDITQCALRNLSWVIPSGQNSDHPRTNTAGGPSWVASIVNAIGQSSCVNADGSTYWDSTAILITWDDWGGWYDHEPPTILTQPQGDYQYGFRVPLIFVSAYTRAGFVSNVRLDFGSLLRFVEINFGALPGALNFADARAADSLSGFFNLKTAPRPFVPIPAIKGAAFFLNDKTPALDPDDD